VLMIRVGLQPSATTGVLIPDPRSSIQPSDQQGPNKHEKVTYQRLSQIEVVVVMDYEGVIAAMLIILITADLVGGASAGIPYLNIP
jgi:hypothetical protein